MERIVITEEDLTTNVVSLDSTDVVYVPGFSNVVPGTISGAFVAPAAFEPTLCTSVAQFEACFGKSPAAFAVAQNYPVKDATHANGFPTAAVPEAVGGRTNTWFNVNDPDPSYIYAKELLLSGIPVIYERVNGIQEETFTATGGQETYTLTFTPINYDIFVNGVKLPSERYSQEGLVITFNPALVEGDVVVISGTVSGDITVDKMYNVLATRLFKIDEELGSDTGSKIINKDYQIKYITTGGYPSFEYTVGEDVNTIAKQMALVAQRRGDAIALIDHTNKPERVLVGQGSVEYEVNHNCRLSETDDLDTYAAMITPWANFGLIGSYIPQASGSILLANSISDIDLGGSFAYLTCLAKSLKSNPNWYAIAGATRGLVPNLRSLRVNKVLTNAIANNYQNDNVVCINAITNIKPYGYCIWGNRTMRNQASTTRKGYAIGFLNLRNLICDVKKQAYLAALSLMFEQNTDVLWVNFKALITPLLDKMVSGSGLSGYKIVKVESDSKTKLKAIIKVYPVYAVEKFDIAIQITDDEVTVA